MFNPIIVVGLGGIGSHLIEPLARYLNAQEELETQLILADGDTYSLENQERQKMVEEDAGKNKAEVQAARLKPVFPKLSILILSRYIAEENVREIITEGSCIFSCVDNHATRKIISDAVLRLNNGLLISGGNNYDDGNIQVFWRTNRRCKTPPLDKHHPEIKYPQDQNPAELSCEELARLPHSNQIIMANLTVACLMLNAYHTIITTERIPYGEVYFDITENKVNPRPRN